LEALDYAVWSADLCAAGVGSPHIRQRLFWVAWLADATESGRAGSDGAELSERGSGQDGEDRGLRLEHAESYGREQGRAEPVRWFAAQRRSKHEFWRNVDYIYCQDGKYRPVGPGTFPLAHGIPGRVAQLRGLGNAIVPQLAAEFIGTFIDMILE